MMGFNCRPIEWSQCYDVSNQTYWMGLSVRDLNLELLNGLNTYLLNGLSVLGSRTF